MEHPFFAQSEATRAESVGILRTLIDRAAELGTIRYIEIPCVDASAIKSESDKADLIRGIQEVMPIAERNNIGIVFETSLPPQEFREFLMRFNHPLVGANFDTGNSASLGYEPVKEIRTLGDLIRNIHIKDRLLGGTTVPLGTGNADLNAVFRTLGEI